MLPVRVLIFLLILLTIGTKTVISFILKCNSVGSVQFINIFSIKPLLFTVLISFETIFFFNDSWHLCLHKTNHSFNC